MDSLSLTLSSQPTPILHPLAGPPEEEHAGPQVGKEACWLTRGREEMATHRSHLCEDVGMGLRWQLEWGEG